MKIHLLSYLAVGSLLVTASQSRAFEASDFSELIGFTVIAIRAVDSVTEGKAGEKFIRLQDGTTFQVSMLLLDPLPASHVVIFGRSLSQEDAAYTGTVPKQAVTLYKIALRDRIYNATLVAK